MIELFFLAGQLEYGQSQTIECSNGAEFAIAKDLNGDLSVNPQNEIAQSMTEDEIDA